MKNLVSTDRVGVFTAVASLSIVWVACSMLVLYAYPYVWGPGLVGWALSAALWTSLRSTRSKGQALHHVEAEPRPALAARTRRLVAPIVASLSLCPVFLSGETTDPAVNLSACKNGGPSCDRSLLTLEEMTDVARTTQVRNVWNCRNGRSSCDRWKLTEAEATAVAVADYDRNVLNCMTGLNSCAH
jgi:hypothetical protein